MTPTEFTSALETAVESRDRDALNMLQQTAAADPALLPIWEQHQRLEQAIGSWKASQPEVQLSEAVIQQLKPTVAATTQSSSSVTPRRNADRQILAAIGGSLALLFLSFFIWNQFQPDSLTQGTIATNDDQTPPENNEPNIKPELNEEPIARVDLTGLFREAGSSYKSLADDTMNSLADGVVLTASLEPATTNWKSPLPNIYEWPGESVKPVSDWSKSIERAMDFLLSDENKSGSAG